jgi:pimeloyl-ACP methyl ester carboxylesterase
MGPDPNSRQSPNTMNARVIPIVTIPGLMGTRLRFINKVDGEEYRWDPNKKWTEMLPWKRLSATKKARILRSTNPAAIIDENKDNGWGALVDDFYDPLQQALKNEGDLYKKAKNPLWAVGFDWRQTCADSATKLGVKIDFILEKERAEKVILITHSMGGLVARAAIQQVNRVNDRVLGVVHVAQPVAGSVALYRRLFTGMQSKWDGKQAVCDILGNSPYEFITPLSGIQGVFELLPTYQYRYLPKDSPDSPDPEFAKLRGPWESDGKGEMDSKGRTIYWGGIAKLRYTDTDSPPGMFSAKIHGSRDSKETEQTKNDVKDNILRADHFHEKVKLFIHRNPWSIYGTGSATDVAVKYPVKDDKFDDLLVYRTGEGDGTVPDASAAALLPDAYEGTTENVRHADYRQFYVKGAQHAEIFENQQVLKILVQILRQMIRYSLDPP